MGGKSGYRIRERDLNKFLKSKENSGKNVMNLNEIETELTLKTRSGKSNGLISDLSTPRAFFNWLVTENLAQNNPANDLKPPRVVRKVVSTLS